MPIADAIENYVAFASKVYSEKKLGGKESLFKATQFETAFQDIVKNVRGRADAPMMYSPAGLGCQRYVEAVFLLYWQRLIVNKFCYSFSGEKHVPSASFSDISGKG